MELIKVKLENDYEDGSHSERVIGLPAPTGDIEAWWEDVVWPETGDGSGESMNACYTATILEASDASLVGLEQEWV